MRAYRVEEFGSDLRLFEGPDPEPAGTEVLVRTLACGVCHSDVHLHDGYFELGGEKRLPMKGVLPMVLGHEVMGEVLAVGPEAKGVGVGDRRVVYPWVGCGECAVCGAGQEQLCARPNNIGIHRGGGFGDRVLVPHPRYLFEKGDVSDDIAGSYACSGLTAYGALKKLLPVDEREHVVVIGAGGLGMMSVEIAKAVWGVSPIVVDIDDAKLESARKAGASHTVNSTAQGAADEIQELTGGGAAGAIDFVGSEASTGFGLGILRRGADLVIVGLFGGQLEFPLPFFPLLARGVKGSYVGSLQEMGELMEHVAAGRITPIPHATRPAEEAGQVLQELRDGKVIGRAVLVHG